MKLVWIFTVLTLAFVVSAQVDCSQHPHAISNISPTQCSCVEGYYWNGLDCAVDCSKVTNSNGSPQSLTECQCNSGFSWNGTACTNGGSSTLDCTTVNGAIGHNGNDCVCNSSLIWNATSKKCIVNCSGVTNSNGTNSGDVSCNCNSGYVWSGTACVNSTQSGNCSSIGNCLGPNGQGGCTCVWGYYWDSSNSVCQINCTGLAHSNGTLGIACCSCE